MDERLQSILDGVGRDELAKVAAGALGMTALPDPGRPAFAEIRKPHSDPRTIGIVHVSGTTEGGGKTLSWSAVAKLVDLKVPNTLGTPVDPENEVRVYESGLFADLGLNLRPAKCFHVSRPREGLIVLWLEDLTGAESAPFSIDALAEMARHLGEWNAVVAADPPALGFAIGHDFQWVCFQGFNFAQRIDDLRAIADEPIVRTMYSSQPLDFAGEFVAAYAQLAGLSLRLPHVLSLADCPIGNFFHRPGETIAIDWAGLGSEPVGADGGRLIGSAMTWGRHFAEVARNERELFETYLRGLREGGSRERREVLRAGYLSEAAFYLCTLVVLPTLFAGPSAKLSLEFLEKRFDMPPAQFGEATAEVINLLAPYVDEMRELAVIDELRELAAR